ncbi:hypothetical protein PHYPSEUDO_004077 [Phytophthora pseudosyringae]|uniref:Uncharacterized protein n=1 Tax=Phytophthora pseudosyringae TaxID=221518 RepID=A0A8T1VSB6_9STRA|nr:hypothetical protein PHYPSEUDO_004077 [Phytophthora pseudosyringae]
MLATRFSFGGYRKSNESLPEFPAYWGEVIPLMDALSDVNNALSKCVRRLRFFLLNVSDHDDDQIDIESSLTGMLQMLEINEGLEYIDVIAPSEYQHYITKFRKHHLEPIYRSHGLSVRAKLAFLSVSGTSNAATKKRQYGKTTVLALLSGLDQFVVTKIFAFAAPPILRQVYFREGRETDTSSGGGPAT